MSAVNRFHTDRIAHDNYPTPVWVTRALFDEIGPRLPDAVRRGRWLEPCAGSGAIIDAIGRAGQDRPYPHRWLAYDIRPEAVAELDHRAHETACIDYLAQPAVAGVDLIITNPPFSLADQIARKAVAEAPIVCLLLSLIWPKAGKRAAWLREHPPSCYPIPQPIPFVLCWSCPNELCKWQGSSLPAQPGFPACPHCAGKLRRSAGDMVGYGWFVWGLDDPPVYRVLRHTSLAERREAREA